MDARDGSWRGQRGDEERGRRALNRLRTIAQLFDQAFAIPGTKWRFGLDALFGLVPGLGDIAGALVAVYAMQVARQLNAPTAVRLHMLSNIALDALIGMVPIAGDLFDFAFKAQTRNLALLERLPRHTTQDCATQPPRDAAHRAGHDHRVRDLGRARPLDDLPPPALARRLIV